MDEWILPRELRDCKYNEKLRKMDGVLYKAAKEGNVDFLLQINPPTSGHEEGDGGSGSGTHGEISLSRTNQNNNIVHIASGYGHAYFIQVALERFSVPFDEVNSKGDTPLHVAARFGHLRVVKLLVNHYFKSLSTSQREEDRVMETETETNSTPGREIGGGLAGQRESLSTSPREENRVTETDTNSMSRREMEERPAEDVLPPLWRVLNLEGTTALHEALRNGNEAVSLYLLQLDPEMACFVNGAGVSVLYLAAESRCEKVMQTILVSEWPYSVQGPHGQNPLHAAKFCSESSITLLLEKRPELAKQADDHGKTALHYAVEANNWRLIPWLLKFDTSIAYLPDMEGLQPLLRASSIGHWKACQVLLNVCPDSIEAHNRNGQNAVHLFNVQGIILRKFMSIPGIRELINECDHDGNTPLHLAIKNRDYTKARLLLRIGNVNLEAINKEGLTALDMCESDWTLSDEQTRTWHTLKLRGASRGRRPNQSNFPYGGPKKRDVQRQPERDWKQVVNTLSVVAALLATVTFTAAFTMPGGYNNSGDNLGAAVLIRKAALQVFVLADTFAMCCSITVLFFLLWAMMGEPELLFGLINFSLMLIKFALYATLVAFVTGLYAVTAPEALWVAILVCVMGSIVPFTTSGNMVVNFAIGFWGGYFRYNPLPVHERKRKRAARPIVKQPPPPRLDQMTGESEET